MSYTNDPIYDEIVREITEEFHEWWDQNWDGTEEWEELKDTAIQELYNNNDQQVEQDYHKLMFYLRVIKEDDEEYGGTFSDWDNPQKIVNLAYYFVATRFFGDFEEADFEEIVANEEDTDDEEPLTNEEADEEVFALFGE